MTHGHKNRIHPSSNEAVMSGWFDSKRPLALSIGMTGISVFCIAFPVKNSEIHYESMLVTEFREYFW